MYETCSSWLVFHWGQQLTMWHESAVKTGLLTELFAPKDELQRLRDRKADKAQLDLLATLGSMNDGHEEQQKAAQLSVQEETRAVHVSLQSEIKAVESKQEKGKLLLPRRANAFAFVSF